MRILDITYPDVNNGTGFRVTLWVSGCSHRCKGCHNPETWDFKAGHKFCDDDKKVLFNALGSDYIKGLTLSGGDPICSYGDVLSLVSEIKEKFKDKDIWLFTGFTKEEMDDKYNEILKYIDVLVDGKFIEEEKDLSLAFRGSRNQRIWVKGGNNDFFVVDDDYFKK